MASPMPVPPPVTSAVRPASNPGRKIWEGASETGEDMADSLKAGEELWRKGAKRSLALASLAAPVHAVECPSSPHLEAREARD
jgi:hypothetical protein